ncbi:MAG TPA: citrate synthase [Sulfurihydrogenibium sp.]|uniref:citrate synthase n=1 Tax=Sulfurihydrogenibium sp. (strain YO3AOP1) TaxID=436114 RepID=UPI0001723406|nr:citrate synthase [Sulfurihydrogenibium sp. YO3AOP1]ACD66813.1 Citrate (Si)-synthase [Sulfurihydrogenibium sp. YO3AOP1]HBT99441.1 citrate synthase [Sulfurihydrogenibium sp.]
MDIIPGLADVPVAYTKICLLDGKNGKLIYRGYDVEELFEKSKYLETVYLLIFGDLPSKAEYENFKKDIKLHSRLKFRIIDVMKNFPEKAHPIEVLQSVVSCLGMFYKKENVLNEDYQYLSIVKLLAKIPLIIANWNRIRNGDNPLEPNPDFDYVENFLYMYFGQKPTKEKVEILEKCLILHAEHSMNASTFAAIVVGSTLADPFTVISSAIGALSGPLHGGANEDVIKMFKEIESLQNVKKYIDEKLESKKKIPGFGHRIYKTYDPRAKLLKKILENLEIKDEELRNLYSIAQEVEKYVLEKLSHKGVYPNVDFYSGLVYKYLGFGEDMYTSLFALARVSGWLAHWKEYITDNKLIRPTEIYIGEIDKKYNDRKV